MYNEPLKNRQCQSKNEIIDESDILDTPIENEEYIFFEIEKIEENFKQKWDKIKDRLSCKNIPYKIEALVQELATIDIGDNTLNVRNIFYPPSEKSLKQDYEQLVKILSLWKKHIQEYIQIGIIISYCPSPNETNPESLFEFKVIKESIVDKTGQQTTLARIECCPIDDNGDFGNFRLAHRNQFVPTMYNWLHNNNVLQYSKNQTKIIKAYLQIEQILNNSYNAKNNRKHKYSLQDTLPAEDKKKSKKYVVH